MRITILLLTCSIIFVSCQSYEEIPLDKGQILIDVEEQNKYEAIEHGLSFQDAQRIMSENNPILKELRLEYEKFKELSSIQTPFPNPNLKIGQSLGKSIDEKSANSIQPFIGFGFTIPLGPRLARNDDLKEALMLRSYNNLVLKHRKLYFDLRESFTEFYFESLMLKNQQKILDHLKLNLEVINKLLKSGLATAIDQNSANIQFRKMQIKLYETESNINQIKSELGQLLGKDLQFDQNFKLIAKSQSLKDFDHLDVLKRKLLESNFELSQLEMDYKVSEVQLKLELAKQYPDLVIGTSAEQEPGESKKVFSLGLSLNLPIFDRNQHKILEKDKERKLILAKYNSALSNSLSRIKLMLTNSKVQKQKLHLLESQIIPLSKATVNKAKRAVEAGNISILRYIDLSKDLFEQELEKIKASKQLNKIRQEIERLIGEKQAESD